MERDGTRVVYRVLDLIGALGDQTTGASVSNLSKQLGLASPTVHRLMRVLVDRRFAVQDPVSKRYALGPAISSLANQAAAGARLAAIGHPIIQRLSSYLNETVYLSVLDDNEIVYLDCVLAKRSIRMWGAPGMRAPLHATAQGKALLAFLPGPAVERILRTLKYIEYTQQTIKDEATLRRALARIREQGFAVNDEELEDGVRSAAAPVLNASGYAVAVVCAGVPAFRATPHQLREHIAPVVVSAANEISALANAFGIKEEACLVQDARRQETAVQSIGSLEVSRRCLRATSPVTRTEGGGDCLRLLSPARVSSQERPVW